MRSLIVTWLVACALLISGHSGRLLASDDPIDPSSKAAIDKLTEQIRLNPNDAEAYRDRGALYRVNILPTA